MARRPASEHGGALGNREGALDNATIPSYCAFVRRKEGALVPLEISILETGVDLARRGVPEAHGFLFAREMRDRHGARRLTAYGTLYKALDRLERGGHLASRWEDPMVAAEEGRPRRRFYHLTVVGERALQDVRAKEAEAVRRRSAAVVRA